MAHFAKYTASAAGHLTAHFERAKDAEGEYIKFGNQDIDTEKSHLNYNLAPHHDRGQIDFIRQRSSEVKIQKRDDVKVMCSWVVTLPQGDYTSEQQRAFFDESYRFLSTKYGEKNVISSYVHLDESQPHMHFSFMPIVFDRKWNEKHPDAPREKVSAKECITKKHLTAFHTDFQRQLDERFGTDFYMALNGATQGGNLTIQELKYKDAIEMYENEQSVFQDIISDYEEKAEETAIKYKQVEEQLSDMRQNLSDAHTELLVAKDELNTVQSDNEDLRGEYSALTELISERKSDLDLVEKEIAVKMNEEASQFGSMESMKERIATAKVDADKNNRLQLLERFIDLPQIKPLFERFVQIMKHSKNKSNDANKNERDR